MSATIAGWGTTQEGVMEMSTYLREGEIQIVPAAQCPAATSLHHLYNFESMICAYSSQQVDTCQVRLMRFFIVSQTLIIFVSKH